jgi:hypothetical protein
VTTKAISVFCPVEEEFHPFILESDEASLDFHQLHSTANLRKSSLMGTLRAGRFAGGFSPGKNLRGHNCMFFPRWKVPPNNSSELMNGLRRRGKRLVFYCFPFTCPFPAEP